MLGFKNIPPVTLNLLLINVMLFLVTLFFEANGTQLSDVLGGHYVNSPAFEPYQLVSHFFMHGGVLHLAFNMMALMLFGSFLETVWGAKRYFVFYIICAFGAFGCYNLFGAIELNNLAKALSSQIDLTAINDILHSDGNSPIGNQLLNDYLNNWRSQGHSVNMAELQRYVDLASTPVVGASGAIFGLSAAFAMLAPNTELVVFPIPIPIKAKYLISAFFLLDILGLTYSMPGDNIAHLAHIGGAITGAVIVFIWQRNRKNFY